MTTTKSKMLITIIYMIMTAYIVAVLPKACDVEYEREHPTYISASDQFLIDNLIKDK